jgi:hypothetical protein
MWRLDTSKWERVSSTCRDGDKEWSYDDNNKNYDLLFVKDFGISGKVLKFSEELVEFLKFKIAAKGHSIFNIQIIKTNTPRTGMPW